MFTNILLLATTAIALAVHAAEVLTKANSTIKFDTLDALYRGNQRFRASAGRRAVAARVVEEPPSFMFIGCLDNRLSPAAIFQTPVGSIVSQNNIANQYSAKDISTDTAVTYAVETLNVKHIIVLGHYGCKGVQTAINGTKSPNGPTTKWIQPVIDMYRRSRRQEIVQLRDSRMPRRGLRNGVTEAPNADEPGFRALVEENVKKSVDTLRSQSILAKAYQRSAKGNGKNTGIEVFVHGLVHDPATGEVMNLGVSFGPPGKKVLKVPFAAIAVAKNFQGDKHLPGFFMGKSLKLGSIT